MLERIKINYWIILFLVLVVYASHSQIIITPKIPANIVHALDSLYPGEKDVEWVKRLGTYKADFIFNDFNVSITFDRDNKVIKGKEEVKVTQLPEKIAASILKECEGYKILFIIQEYNKRHLYYEVEIMKGGDLFILDFNEMGYLVDKSIVSKTSLYFNAVN